jgi:MerR family transcriptional regulator, light-induced transcriptional regulator
MADGLTTTQLAARLDVRPGTLRMWESRYGFPRPARSSGGHRRYSEREAELVRHVVVLRARGMSVPAAIERARASAAPAPASIFAGLREQRPGLEPAVLSKRALVALSRSLEDEYCARAAGGVLIASFQRTRFYRQSERRWRELARTAELAVALADFPVLRSSSEAAPLEIPVDRDHPLSREWALVVDAPGAQSCLAAWEMLAGHALEDRQRRFEVLWSFDPAVVEIARATAGQIIRDIAPDVADRLGEVGGEGTSAPPDLGYVSGLVHRMVGYLGAAVADEEPGLS